jgi:hypothetical protein
MVIFETEIFRKNKQKLVGIPGWQGSLALGGTWPLGPSPQTRCSDVFQDVQTFPLY